MGRHMIDKNEIKGFASDVILASAHGNGENKSLKAHVVFDSKEITFKVVNKGNEIASVHDLNKAINIYNEI